MKTLDWVLAGVVVAGAAFGAVYVMRNRGLPSGTTLPAQPPVQQYSGGYSPPYQQTYSGGGVPGRQTPVLSETQQTAADVGAVLGVVGQGLNIGLSLFDSIYDRLNN